MSASRDGLTTRGATKPVGGRISGNYSGRVIDICAGPGGMDMGARILGLDPMIGVELDDDAVATGRAAGFERRQHDMRLLSPKRHRGLRGAVLTPPCPTFNASGKGTGRQDMQTLLDAITCLGIDCGCEWPDLPGYVQDIRSALVIEPARWLMQCPTLEWMVCEQVWQVKPVWEDITAEAYAAGWNWVEEIELDAADYGMPVRRRRSFLIARRSPVPPTVSVHDGGWYGEKMARYTMAGVLGLDPELRVWTRGNRKTSGGNSFRVDRAGWSLTGKARSWQLGYVGGPQMTAAQAGLLQGFPLDFPWKGSRSKQFLQLADVVHPAMAAIVLGVATDTPWVEPVRAYLEGLYGPGEPPAPKPAPAPVFEQLGLAL